MMNTKRFTGWHVVAIVIGTIIIWDLGMYVLSRYVEPPYDRVYPAPKKYLDMPGQK